MYRHTPESIVEVLHSISSVKIDADGEVLVQYHDTGDEYHGPMGYEYGSFTRLLLELIEAHLSGEKVCLCYDDDSNKDV